ncbi:MAG: DUF4446 family protein [Patescibacteria group bacterium]
MNIKLQIAFFVFLGLIVLVESIWIIKTESRLRRFFLGKKGKDLEETILFLQNEINNLKQAREKMEKDIVILNEKLRKSIRGLDILRFNPFPDQGSNQSFAIGMLNEDKDGIVISSLYSRERMSVFAKPIKNGKSEYELSDEEKEVLKKAEVN